MKHIVFLLLIAGLSMSTACSTYETNSESDEGSAMPAETTPAAPAEKPAVQAPVKSTAEETSEPETQEPATTDASSDGSDITYVCTHDNSVRTIRVIHHNEGSMVCEVTYEKSTGTQSLWNANSDESYCATKAADFVAKQEGWGWECNKQ